MVSPGFKKGSMSSLKRKRGSESVILEVAWGENHCLSLPRKEYHYKPKLVQYYIKGP